MKRIDLEEGCFRQQDVLRMVPTLSERTLLNWVERGIIESEEEAPGSGTPRLYSPLGVIMLAFITRVVELGIKPSVARDMAEKIANHALKLHKRFQAEKTEGRLTWTAQVTDIPNYHRAYIYGYDRRGHRLRIERGYLNEVARSILPDIYIVVEVDLLILGMLNTIYKGIVGST